MLMTPFDVKFLYNYVPVGEAIRKCSTRILLLQPSSRDYKVRNENLVKMAMANVLFKCIGI